MNPVPVTIQKAPLDKQSAPPLEYSATRIWLYGTPINRLDTRDFKLSVNIFPSSQFELALIYGYAYQGYCYSLPQPVILAIDKTVSVAQPAKGCGYDGNQGYLMWSADKLDQTIELRVRQGFFEEVVLEENLPGKKLPQAYSAATQLAHRNGRLVE